MSTSQLQQSFRGFAMSPRDIRAKLASIGATQTQLAASLGLSREKISRALAGKRSLSAQEMDGIHRFFLPELSAELPRPPSVIAIFGFLSAEGRVRYGHCDDVVSQLDTLNGALACDWGIRIASDAMMPRLMEGEVVLVREGLAPAPQKDCVITLSDGTAVVGLYDGRRDGLVYLRQLNPLRLLPFSAAAVLGVHSVVMRL